MNERNKNITWPVNGEKTWINSSRFLWIIFLLLAILHVSSATVPSFQRFEFVRLPNHTVVVPGQTTTLSCTATFSAAVVYSWSRNGDLLPTYTPASQQNRIPIENGSLYFQAIIDRGLLADPGRYRCIAEASPAHSTVYHRIITPAISLRIASLGDFIAQPSDLTLVTGDTAMFRCEVESVPEANYIWLKNGSPITPTSRVLSHDRGLVLEIRNISPIDAGEYRCKAKTMAGDRSSRRAALTITSETSTTANETATSVTLNQTLTTESQVEGMAPGFVLRPWDTTAVEGNSVILFCAVNGSDSSGNLPTVKWLKDGSTVDTTGSSSGYRIVGSGSLSIGNVSRDLAGTYTCRGENLNDITDAEATLTVQIPPYYIEKPANTYGRIGEEVVLKCVVGGSPEPTITWYKESEKIEPNAYFEQVPDGSLKIKGLLESDSGYFQCMAKNNVGSIQTVMQLIVLSSDAKISTAAGIGETTLPSVVPIGSALPLAPENLRVVIASQKYITLTWQSSLRPGEAPITTYTVITTPAAAVGNTNVRVRAVNTTLTDYTVEDLVPNTAYVFQVIAYNRNGRSPQSKTLRRSTNAEVAVPGRVVDMSAFAPSHSTIRVSWEPPEETNGKVEKYRVYYYTTDQSKEQNEETILYNVLLENLHPYTEYHIRVVAINQNGPGTPTTERTVRTKSAKPSATPANVTMEVTGTTTVQVHWNPPPAEHINGQLTGFKMKFKERNPDRTALSHTTDADARTFRFTDLSPGVEYQVRIAAVNINGTGEYSPRVFGKTLIRDLDESRPPGQPAHLQIKTFAREIIVSWSPPPDESRVVIRGYKLGYGTITPHENWVQPISSSLRFHTLEGLQPQQSYVVQLIAYNNAGDSPNIMQQGYTREDQYSPQEVELMPPLAVRVNVISATSVVVTWHDNTLSANQKVTDERYYTIKYNALSASQRRTKYVNSTSLVKQIDGLRPFTQYAFSVMITKDHDKVSSYSLSARNTTFEAAPSTTPEELTITAMENKPSYLYVSWQPPSRPNGQITYYYLYSNTNNEEPIDRWIVERVFGYELNHQFGPVTPSTVYYFRIAALNNKGSSPLSTTKVVNTANIGGGGFMIDSPSGGTGEKLPLNPGGGGNVIPGNDKPGGGGGYAIPGNNEPITDDTTTQATGMLSTNTLWIIIACVGGVTAIAVAALVAVLCRRRITNERNKPANLKATNQAPKGMSNCKSKPPDLWIDHEQVELKGMSQSQEPNDPDEMTSMLHGQYGDMDRSVSYPGEIFPEETRYSTLGRQRPIIMPSQPQRDAMPRAAVPPMNVDTSRPLYPRTQFTPQYGSTPRVHVGDTSQPSENYQQHFAKPHHHMNGMGPPGVSTSPMSGVPPPLPKEGRAHPLRSFHVPAPPLANSHIPKHIVKPLSSPYKPPPPPPPQDDDVFDTNSLKRPPRPPYASRNADSLSISREDMKSRTRSTEQLSEELDHLNSIMQNLHAMKNDFE